MDQFDNPLVMTEDGILVSDKWLRLSEILQDIDPYLELRWIPPKARNSEESKPYAVCHCPPIGRAYVIMFAGDDDNPIDLLARLWEGNAKNQDVLRSLELREKAEEAFKLRESLELHAELADQTHFLATNRSPFITKHKTADGKIVKLDHNGRRV